MTSALDESRPNMHIRLICTACRRVWEYPQPSRRDESDATEMRRRHEIACGPVQTDVYRG